MRAALLARKLASVDRDLRKWLELPIDILLVQTAIGKKHDDAEIRSAGGRPITRPFSAKMIAHWYA